VNALALANSYRAARGRPSHGLGLRELPPPPSVELVNELTRGHRLGWPPQGPLLERETEAAEAAHTEIELLAGRIRRCGHPRCTLFVLANGRRRCSQACATRARVARERRHA
jgi:predicted RNA-binding Zn ribbon-like protein